MPRWSRTRSGPRVQRHRHPLAAGAASAWGVVLSPAVGALLMSLSTIVVALNATLLLIAPRAGRREGRVQQAVKAQL